MAENFQVPVPASWGFPAESTALLARRLARAGAGATLTVVPYESGGLMRLWLRVVPAESAETEVAFAMDTDINDSRPCPPFTGCSGGGD
jgi:hypothetical protein